MPYYLNALGIINSLGDHKKDVIQKILKGDPQGLLLSEDYLLDESVFVGEVRSVLPKIPVELSRFNCRNNQFLLAALNQIELEVEKAVTEFGNDRVAVVIGSSTSGIAEGEKAVREKDLVGKWPETFDYQQQEVGSPSLFLKTLLGLQGLHYTISTACSSSARVFNSGRNLLALGLCDAVIVGGADSLCQLTVRGFKSLEAISKNKTNPMSKNRDGINIGEGAALFVMTKNHAQDDTEDDWELVGYGDSSDAHHISAPEPEGLGAEVAIRRALKDAKISPEEISYVNLHGTGTELNDIMEAKAFVRVFNSEMPCSSVKPMIGHTLGASGVIELAICCLLVSSHNKSGALPPHLWDAEHDDDIPKLNLAEKEVGYLKSDKNYIMSNSFAFGGNNCSLIIRRSLGA